MNDRTSFFVGLGGVLLMVVAIVYGLSFGSFGEELSAITSLAWGRVTLIDLYLGLLLIAAWIVHRERNPARAIVWILLLVSLGNLASCAYVMWAAAASRGDAGVFWNGRRA